MGLKDKLARLERDESPEDLQWRRRVYRASKISRALDGLPLSRAAAYVAAREAAGRDGEPDELALLQEHLGLDPLYVQAVIGDGDERSMALWRGCLRGFLARAHSPAYRPGFLRALRRERLRRGLSTDESEEL